jgi:DNA adenine methylase
MNNNQSIIDAHPFVKWAGGKRHIINELIKRIPNKFNNYYEPFVGGGALYFKIYKLINKAYLSDINHELICAYNVIKNNVLELIELLKIHAKNHNKEYYYKIRNQHNLKNPIEISARFLYLNKTCYNGLYRVNKKGEFNVPMGSYKNPNIIQEDNLKACNKILQNAIINEMEFDKINPNAGDFVYFDPPYYFTTSNSFTSYTSNKFNYQDHIRLRDFILYLDKKGVMFMLSNSNNEFIIDLYKDFNFKIEIVKAPRFINCDASKRNESAEELIIYN